MILISLIQELCLKKENSKAGCTLTFGGQGKKNFKNIFFKLKTHENLYLVQNFW